MKVLVDTSIWSLAFRRRKGTAENQNSLLAEHLELIKESRAYIIGPVRQEILSGISSEAQFEKLRDRLSAFEDLEIVIEDYELAAVFYNRCRRNGIQGSHIDFLICAVAHRYAIPVFTVDKDFNNYSSHVDITLHCPRAPLSMIR